MIEKMPLDRYFSTEQNLDLQLRICALYKLFCRVVYSDQSTSVWVNEGDRTVSTLNKTC